MNRQAVSEVRELFIQLHENQCDQSFYVAIRKPLRPIGERGRGCGAAACAAGWTALTQAPTMEHGPTDLIVEVDWALAHDVPINRKRYIIDGKDYAETSIVRVAQAALDLDGQTTAILFTPMPRLRGGETDREWVIRQLDTLLAGGELDYSEVEDDDEDEDDDWNDGEGDDDDEEEGDA